MKNNQKPNHINSTNQNRLLELAIDYLKNQISKQTNITKGRIRNNDSLDKYGIDSVAIMSMTKTMESDLGKLSKTLFFEYNTVDDLAKYLLENKLSELAKLFGETINEEIIPEKDTAVKSSKLNKLGIIKRKDQVPPKKTVLKGLSKPAENIIDNSFDDEIAIVGLAGKYPMADDLEEFWDNLKSGKDCITEIPEHRWDNSEYFSEKKGDVGKTYAKWGGFINDVEMFDPLFFNMTPLEAAFTDPQERLFLETTWHAFENAGYSKKELNNKKVGVFVGVMFGLYQLIESYEYGEKMTGRCNFASIANRVSYFFNFHGPSIALDTMCSSSLTALHLACNSIKNGESEMAVVGGVNLIIHPNKYVQLSQGGFLSTDGKCRSFGSGGDGYVPGEGVGAIIIKPLKKAIEDGDHIYALVKSTAVNAGGKTNGYTVPNPAAQTEVIKTALKEANVDARAVSYIETHGTGTKLGDPIEITGMTNAYRNYTDDKEYCAIGSVKSNIGHLESAAGVAAITKVLLQMKNKKLVPSINSRKLNEFIDFEETPFYVQRELADWQRPIYNVDGKNVSHARCAGVSAFGAGGSNAHIILEEYSDNQSQKTESEIKPRLFILSAKNEKSIETYAKEMWEYICGYTGTNLQIEEKNEFGSVFDSVDIIKKTISDILHISPNDVNENDYFCDLGIDKYQLDAFCKKIQEKTEKSVAIDFITSKPTVLKLAEYLCEGSKIKSDNNNKDVDLNLDDLAYTLQIGRTEMEERLAIIASDAFELRDLLSDFINGVSNDNIISGNTNNYLEKFDDFIKSDSGVEYTNSLLKEENYGKIAELWISGISFDWSALYSKRMNRLSLPTYPFLKVRCWVTENTENGRLVQENLYHSNKKLKGIAEKTKNLALSDNKKIDKTTLTNEKLSEMVVEYLKQAFSAVLKIPVEQLQEDISFEAYGLDSIYINQLNIYFENYFGKLPSSLLFTYKNIKSLSKYFIKEQREKIIDILLGNADEFVVENHHINENLNTVNADNKIQVTDNSDDDIAIIGLSGQYPKSENLDEYLKNLLNGEDLISEIPAERWDYRDYPDVKCKWGGFVSDADKFDPQFFNITPNNAKFMDPQERRLLEMVWSCLEDSGYSPNSLCSDDDYDNRGNVAVYVGVSFNTYGLNGVKNKNMPINTQLYSVANRISYLLNLKGPSLSVDTACSSSLYAIHMGCESILRGECDMAIAGGVNLTLHPSKYVTLNYGGFLASDGHCRSFGEGGDGYVPGEGIGAVLLKPLKKAIEDNDHIYGVIKGTAVNHGGKTNGYSVPNPVAQSEVIKKALSKAKINPADISYIEAHGTGTSLGDPIEIDALTSVFKDYTEKKQYCAIGSVKSNAGHLEAAAGIAQMTKVLLQFKSEMLFPSRLNSDSLNHNIHFEDTPFYVQTSAEKWNVEKNPNNKLGLKRAGVSSFGVGGVNVHIVLEEYREPEREKLTSSKSYVLIPMSALSADALNRNIKQLRQFIESDVLPDIRDFAFTLQVGRIELAYRTAFIVHSYEELKIAIDKYLDNSWQNDKGILSAKAKSIVDCPQNTIPLIIENDSDENIFNASECWINGKIIDYSNLYSDYKPHRVSLPTYSFEKETYWLYEREDYSKEDSKNDLSDSSDEPELIDIAKDISESETSGIGDDVSDSNIDKEFIEFIMDLPLSERMENMVSYITDVFADLLGFAEGKVPDPDQGFFDLGLESIETTRAYNRLTELFGLELDMQLFFNYPNINKLSAYIIELLEEQENAETSEDNDNVKDEIKIGNVFFSDRWTPVDLDSNNAAISDALVFTNDRGLFNSIKANDNYKIKNAIQVRKGKKFSFNSKNSSVTVENDFDKLFTTLDNKNITVSNVLYLWDFSVQNENKQENIIDPYITVLKVVKSLMSVKGKCNFIFAFSSENKIIPEKEAIIGMLKTVQIENPGITCKIVKFDDENLENKFISDTLLNELAGADGISVKYRDNQRYECQIQEISPADHEVIKPKHDGVYVVTNYDGVLGLLLAQYMVNVEKCKVIIAGNRDLNDAENAIISNISISNGSAIEYVNTDLSDAETANQFVDFVNSKYKSIDGVIYTAEDSADNKIYTKDFECSHRIARKNILSLINLDSALSDSKLDFFMIISSFITLIGYTGQVDYSYTSQFLKSYAEYRDSLNKNKQRFGKTVSVLWPYYSESNVLSDAETEKWFKNSFGIHPMTSEQGRNLFDKLFEFENTDIGIIYGDIEKIRTLFGFAAKDVFEYFDDASSPDIEDDIDNELDDMDDDELAELLKEMLD